MWSSNSDQSDTVSTLKATLHMTHMLSGIYASHTQNTWLSLGICLIIVPCLKSIFKSYCSFHGD